MVRSDAAPVNADPPPADTLPPPAVRFREVDGRTLATVGAGDPDEDPRPLDVLFWRDGVYDLFAGLCDGGPPPRPEHMYGDPVPLSQVADGLAKVAAADELLDRGAEAIDAVHDILYEAKAAFEALAAVRDAGRAALALHAARDAGGSVSRSPAGAGGSAPRWQVIDVFCAAPDPPSVRRPEVAASPDRTGAVAATPR